MIILNVLSFFPSNFTVLFINTDTFPPLYRFCIFCRRATKIARRERDGRHLHRYLRICIRDAQRDLRLGGFKRFRENNRRKWSGSYSVILSRDAAPRRDYWHWYANASVRAISVTASAHVCSNVMRCCTTKRIVEGIVSLSVDLKSVSLFRLQIRLVLECMRLSIELIATCN